MPQLLLGIEGELFDGRMLKVTLICGRIKRR
jgi:hypothetical protein